MSPTSRVLVTAGLVALAVQAAGLAVWVLNNSRRKVPYGVRMGWSR